MTTPTEGKSPSQQVVDIIDDGQWHSLGDFTDIITQIEPEKALQLYLNGFPYRDRDTARNNLQKDTGRKIASGRLRWLKYLLKNKVQRGRCKKVIRDNVEGYQKC